MGWTPRQWAVAYGRYPEYAATIKDALLLKSHWLLTWDSDPNEESVIKGVEVNFDFDKAWRIIDLVSKKQGEA